jgi:tetratricopeptide (TPR) repeat protein
MGAGRFMGIHFDRGQALFALQRYQEAVVEYQQELAEQPGCVYSKANIASSLINLGKFADARMAVQETLAQAPEYGFAFYLLSFLEPKGGGNSPAMRAINEATRLEPTVVRNVTRLAWLFREQGRHDDCLEATQRALALDPRHVDTLVLRAKALEALGQPDDAAATLREALAIDPEDPDAHLALGNVALACGEPGEALDALREARRISPVKHNPRDKILDALARRVWPFRQIDALVKRWKRLDPLVRWAIVGGVCTALLWAHAVIRPSDHNPSPALTVLYLLLANGLLLVVAAPQYAKLAARIIARRELDLRRRDVLWANLRSILKLAAAHWGLSILSIIMSFSPAFAYFVLVLIVPLSALYRAGYRAQFWGPPEQLHGGVLLLCVFISGIFALGGSVVFSERSDGPAWSIWGVTILLTGAEAAYRSWVARKALG